MPSYTAPTRDMQFILHDVLNVSEKDTPGYAELEPDFTNAVLEEAGKIASEVLSPLNPVGDTEGCVLENGVVRTPTGFKAAFDQVREGGWTALDMPEAYGGQNMPYILGTAVGEMFSGANRRLPCITASPTGPPRRSSRMARTSRRRPTCRRCSPATGPAP